MNAAEALMCVSIPSACAVYAPGLLRGSVSGTGPKVPSAAAVVPGSATWTLAGFVKVSEMGSEVPKFAPEMLACEPAIPLLGESVRLCAGTVNWVKRSWLLVWPHNSMKYNCGSPSGVAVSGTVTVAVEFVEESTRTDVNGYGIPLTQLTSTVSPFWNPVPVTTTVVPGIP